MQAKCTTVDDSFPPEPFTNASGDDLQRSMSRSPQSSTSEYSASSSSSCVSLEDRQVYEVVSYKAMTTPMICDTDGCESQRQRVDVHGGQFDKVCVVCGDVATGFHYEVSSCNGCKTFFRRTIVSGRKFACRKDDNCQFDKNRRCACRACRFHQCIKAGMNPHAIQYVPSANLTLSITRKRFKRAFEQRQKMEVAVEEKGKAKQFRTKVPRSLWKAQDETLKHIGLVLQLEEKHDRLRCSTFNPFRMSQSVEEVLFAPNSFGDADKYPLVDKWPERDMSKSGWQQPNRKTKFWLYLDLYLSIDYLKTFDVFQELTTREKILLIRNTAIAHSALSSAYYSYTQRSRDVIIYPDGSTPLQHQHTFMELELKLRRGVLEKVVDLRPDQVQMSLFHAVMMLNSVCGSLSEEASRRLFDERLKYTKALFSYLQNRHGCVVGNRKFVETMLFTSSVWNYANLHYQYYAYRRYVTQNCCPSTLFQECLENS